MLKIDVYLAVFDDAFNGSFLLSFSHEMSWTISGTELSQFLRVSLPTPTG